MLILSTFQSRTSIRKFLLISRSITTKVIDFNDAKNSFQTKSTIDLIRAYLVFKICQTPILVKNAETLLKFSYRFLGYSITNTILKQTFFGHFCAGENEKLIQSKVDYLKANGVGSILDYASESDILPITKTNTSNSPTAASPSDSSTTSSSNDTHHSMNSSNNHNNHHIKSTVQCRVYDYKNEILCDEQTKTFESCIRAVANVSPTGFAAIKCTALGNPKLLQAISTIIIELQSLFEKFDVDKTGRITKEQFIIAFNQYFISQNENTMMTAFNQLDIDGDGFIDYIEWSNGLAIEQLHMLPIQFRDVDDTTTNNPTTTNTTTTTTAAATATNTIIKDAATVNDKLIPPNMKNTNNTTTNTTSNNNITNNNTNNTTTINNNNSNNTNTITTTTQIKSSLESLKHAILTPNDLIHFKQMKRRIYHLATLAQSLHIRLMIDAEHSYFQPCIDYIVLDLQKQFNHDYPVVFTTYQLYLKDSKSRLFTDIKRANNGKYTFAAKLVRGAYMNLERERAKRLGYEDPIYSSIDETHNNYNECVKDVITLISQQQQQQQQLQQQREGVGSEQSIDNHAHSNSNEDINAMNNANNSSRSSSSSSNDSDTAKITNQNHTIEIMIASHNQQSIELATTQMTALQLNPSQTPVYFGQLLGMSDTISFTLGHLGYQVYKYVPYGKVAEVMPYLIRRAQENADALSGAKVEMKLIRHEIIRRIAG